MPSEAYVLAYDVGTTGCKTCIYRVGEVVERVGSSLGTYPLVTTPDGGVEQRADDWWTALCQTSRSVLARTGVTPQQVQGIAFCCQMQGSVLVDEQGRALRNPMIYLDGRATKQFSQFLQQGWPRIVGLNARKLIQSLIITGGLAATAKDPLWKYHWVLQNEPEIFGRVFKWLDVKDYLVLRCTGRYGMTKDSAHVTFLFDSRPAKQHWHRGLCELFGVTMDHLPPVIESTEVVGGLTARASAELGLLEGTPVFGGGGDVSLISLGAGCLQPNDTHIYVGTSGWVVATVAKRLVDLTCFAASILGAVPRRYNYVAEQETSGLCLQWAREQLANEEPEAEGEGTDSTFFARLGQKLDRVEPGAGQVIFTPWLHGNRAPMEDPHARGIFFNLGLNTKRDTLLRAVLEGVAYHKRWMLESLERKIPYRRVVRFAGGGAKSEAWCQIMADVTGRCIEAVADPQNAGAVGAALVCGVGLGTLSSFEKAKDSISVRKIYFPRTEFRQRYERNFRVFKELYRSNQRLFRRLNATMLES